MSKERTACTFVSDPYRLHDEILEAITNIEKSNS